MSAIPAHIAPISATPCRKEGFPLLRMSGITATHDTYTKPPAVVASKGCSIPAYFVAKSPIAVPTNAASAVANCAPIACHFVQPLCTSTAKSPISCGSSWSSVASAVLWPRPLPEAKAAPMAMPSDKLCKASAA